MAIVVSSTSVYGEGWLSSIALTIRWLTRSAKATIWRGGVCVVARGESEVAEWFCVGALCDDILSCAHELDDGKRDIGIVDSVGLAFLAKKFAQGCGVRLGGKLSAIATNQLNDAGPALRRAHHAADAGAAGGMQELCHGLVCRDHKVLDQVRGAIMLCGFDLVHLAIDDHRVRFNAVELKRALPDTSSAYSACSFILQAQLGLQFRRGGDFRVGSGFALKPRPHLAVGQLGAVVDQGAIDALLLEVSFAVDDEFCDHRGPILVLVQRCQVGRELVGQHGKVSRRGIDGLGLLRGVLIDGSVLPDRCGYVCDADAHPDATGGAYGEFDLIEVARGVVVDGRPQQTAQIAYIGCGFWRSGSANAIYLLLAAWWKVGVESLAHHLGERRCGEVEGMGRHGVPAYHGC